MNFLDRPVAVAKSLLRKLRGQRPATSSNYRFLTSEQEAFGSARGWHEADVAKRQDKAYRDLLKQMYAGQPRLDLQVAVEAIRRTGLVAPTILEVGCGSGYYSEVLTHLLDPPPHYSGLDYSWAMVELARQHYPARKWINGDGTRLPFPDNAYDIIFNGVSLMHIRDYPAAIAESWRVARRWSIFHTVPVLQQRATTTLYKQAYQGETVEIVFNENSLLMLLAQVGLEPRAVIESIPYDLHAVLGESTMSRTYICEVLS